MTWASVDAPINLITKIIFVVSGKPKRLVVLV